MKSVRRLIRQFKPEHYRLELEPDSNKMTFKGRVIISGHKTGPPSQRLTLHQKGLKITTAKFIRHDKTGDHSQEPDRINRHDGFDEVRLHTKARLYPGRYTIELDFSGKITRPMNGLYPCFFEHAGQTKKLLATQFESHHAREVFPCIDEPEAKATFQLSLVTPPGETVISNTPVAKQTLLTAEASKLSGKTKKPLKSVKRLETTFETSPKMSTYLLAFVIGQIEFKETKTASGVSVRTYATPDNVGFTGFALEVAVKILEFYENYFGIAYPLAKCDLIALPDFASGAMENWGCITFREQSLLVDPLNTSLPMKQYVAMVVAHELAHQWFGNLVTMRWWTDLWLNEGFASWIEYLAVDHLFPEWQMWTQFIVDEQQPAMKLDALEHTHPVEVPVNSPAEIHTIFDGISYGKGSSVIHMLQAYLGADNFKAGLRHYLKMHQYGNTDTVDLWAALEAKAHKPVRNFMHAWIAEAGYPVVTLTPADDGLELTQQRFYLNPGARHETGTDKHWPVALLAGQALPEILTDAKAHIRTNTNTEVKLNHGQSGFYRAIYQPATLKRLADQVRRGQFEPLDRLGILSDAFEAAKAGYGQTSAALELLNAYQNEDNVVVWDIIAANLSALRFIMDDEAVREATKPYTRRLVAAQLKRLGWVIGDQESHFDRLLRPTILGLASVAEEPAVVKEALRRFKGAAKPQDIHPDLRGVVYATAVRHGGKTEFDKLLKLHDASRSSEERVTIAAALTGFRQPALIRRALDQIDSNNVRLQDAGYWVLYSFSNRHARKLTWQWMAEHWDWLEHNLGSDISFYRFPIYAARAFSDARFLPAYKKFFKEHMSPALSRSVRQGIETIEWQSAWKQRDLATVRKFFNGHK